MVRRGIPVLLAWLAICTVSVHGAFEGYRVISVGPIFIEEIKYLQTLGEEFVGMDFWQRPTLSHDTRIVLPPSIINPVIKKLDDFQIHWEMENINLSAMVEASFGGSRTASLMEPGQIVDNSKYHNYSEIVSLLYKLKDKYPKNMNISYLPHKTHNGKRVVTVKLFGESCTSTKTIINEAGIHAREWITPAATLYVIEKFLDEYHMGDVKVQMMLDTFDWYFVPVANPDGYDYSHEKPENRLWRKNRKPTTDDCIGVDLNRNFDIVFGTTGTSTDCTSNTYPGTKAFSEAETSNIRDLFLELKSTTVAYMSIHSFSQYVLVPWGYTEDFDTRPKNVDELDRVAYLIGEEVQRSRDNLFYLVGTAFELLGYGVSGASEDWVLSKKQSVYAYCMEMSPSWQDENGFLLPPEEIVSASEDLWVALKVLSTEMRV